MPFNILPNAPLVDENAHDSESAQSSREVSVHIEGFHACVDDLLQSCDAAVMIVEGSCERWGKGGVMDILSRKVTVVCHRVQARTWSTDVIGTRSLERMVGICVKLE